MSIDDFRKDVTLQRLRGLSTLDVDRVTADRVRARCHRILARRDWPGRLAGLAEAPLCRRVLEPTLLAGLSATYLIEVVSRALRLLGS